MKKLIEIFKKFAIYQWRWYLAGTVMLFITSWISLLIPELSKTIVNSFAGLSDPASHKDTALFIVALGLILLLSRVLSRVLLFWPARVLESGVKDHYYNRFLKVKQSFFEKFGMGDLISRIANDVTHIRVFFGFGALQILNFTFMVTLAIFKMTDINGYLTIFALAPILSNIIFMRWGMPKMHVYSRAQQDKLGTLTNKITEAFVNVHVIQSNNAASSFSTSIAEANDQVYKTNVKLAAFRTIVFPLLGLMTGFSYLVVLFYGGRLAMEGAITIGDLMAFNAYLALLSFPLMAIGILLAVLQRARTAADRLNEIDQAEREYPEYDKDNLSLKEGIDSIELRNLSFIFNGEDGHENKVLDNINLVIEKGQHIGIVGPVGSGKSLLLNLLTRIYHPPKGTVFINGKDILEIAPKELREHIGFATQNVHLFSDSVEKNLVFGLESATKEEIEKAAKDAEIANDIKGFENGWDSEIGEKGLRLSGGQKQRLALARTLIRNPGVYLLDDVLSAVDHSTEKAIIESLKSKKSTMIISSHRSSAVKHCDKVIALDKGKLVGEGTFTEISKQFPDFFESEH
jgi:ATP-binding cassette subfamily B protein